MFRIDDTDATVVSPFPLPAAGTEGYFTEGNPSTGVPATKVTEEWLNAIQEEIAHAIESLGGTLDKTDSNQLGDLLSAQGANAVKSHASDTGNVSTSHTRAVMASDTGRAQGDQTAAISTDGGQAGGTNAAVIACEADVGICVTANGENLAIMAALDCTVQGDESAAIASYDAEIVSSSERCATLGADSPTIGTGTGGSASVIVGGTDNTINDNSDNAIAGGRDNTIDNNRGFIGGGDDNLIGTSNAGILAGQGNTVGAAGGAIASVIAGSVDSEIDGVTNGAVVGCQDVFNGHGGTDVGVVMLASKNAQAQTGGAIDSYSVQGGYDASGITQEVTGPDYDQNITWRIHSNDGDIHCDNTTVQALDYAERFEYAKPCAPGMLVARDGLKVRPASRDDRVFGVLSTNPGVIGDAGDLHWRGKFLKDAFGGYVYETLDMLRYPRITEKQIVSAAWKGTAAQWAEASSGAALPDHAVTLPGEPGPQGGITPDTYYCPAVKETKVVREAYDGLKAEAPQTPDDATEYEVTTRKKNPDYDPSRPYVNRAKRDDWGCVGFLGQIYVRVDETVAPDDDVKASRKGIGTKGFGGGKPVECMAITTPYDETKGYAVALCFVG